MSHCSLLFWTRAYLLMFAANYTRPRISHRIPFPDPARSLFPVIAGACGSAIENGARRRKPRFSFRASFWGSQCHILMNTYARLPVAFTHGDGSWVTDTRYVSISMPCRVSRSTRSATTIQSGGAIAAQAGRLLHNSNLYRMPQQEQLADKLAALSGMDEVFFCNSGCEANEAAIKASSAID